MKNEANSVLERASINCSLEIIKTKKSKLFGENNLVYSAHGQIRQMIYRHRCPALF